MKYKYKILILDINKDNLHEELNKYGASGYTVVNVRCFDKGNKLTPHQMVEYTLMKEYKDKKHPLKK